MDAITKPRLSEAQARKLCEKIASEATNLRELLVQLRDGEGWVALGYATWALCCEEEFGYSKQHVNRLVKAAEINRQVEPTGSAPLPERQARELAKVPAEKRPEVLEWATEKADGKPLTAAAIRKAAEQFAEQEPDEEDEEEVAEREEEGDELEPDESPKPTTAKGVGELESFVRKWIDKYDHPICVAAAMLENLAAKIRTE